MAPSSPQESASLTPSLAERLYHQAVDGLAAGDLPTAISGFRASLAADPEYTDAAHGLMHALKDAGQLDEAVAVARSLVTTHPDDVLAHTSLSILYQRQGNIPEAEAAATRAKLLGWKSQLRDQKEAAQCADSMTTFYAATTNPGKLRDFTVAAEAEGVAIHPLPGLGDIPAPAEDEPDFEGNARVKAVHYSRYMAGEIVLADDSGLEVNGLGGEPGVRSARYTDDAGFVTDTGANTDERNNLYLLARLKGVSGEERRARYRCVLAAARDGECLLTAEGTVEGEILTAPRGVGGFGYDPLFYLPEVAKTMAEIDLAEKHRLSH